MLTYAGYACAHAYADVCWLRMLMYAGFMIRGQEFYEGVWVYDEAGEQGMRRLRLAYAYAYAVGVWRVQV